VVWIVEFSRQAAKDAALLFAGGRALAGKANDLLGILESNPFQNPPPYEKLGGDLKGSYSRRINKQHRLLYDVDKKAKIVFVTRMWSHYE
jgi:toxin YoeB